MKFNQLFAASLLFVAAVSMTSCGGGMDWEDPRDRALTAKDTTLIEGIMPKLEACYNYILEDTMPPDTTIGKLPAYSYSDPDHFKLSDLGSLFDPDTVYESYSESWSYVGSHVTDIKNNDYNGELSDFIANMEESKYIVVLQDLLRMDPELMENQFNSGLYFGALYIFDYESSELKRKFSVIAENSESVSYYEHQSSEYSLQNKLEQDLSSQIRSSIRDSINDAFLPYSGN